MAFMAALCTSNKAMHYGHDKFGLQGLLGLIAGTPL